MNNEKLAVGDNVYGALLCIGYDDVIVKGTILEKIDNEYYDAYYIVSLGKATIIRPDEELTHINLHLKWCSDNTKSVFSILKKCYSSYKKTDQRKKMLEQLIKLSTQENHEFPLYIRKTKSEKEAESQRVGELWNDLYQQIKRVHST